MPRISSKNQVTLPVSVLDEAGLRPGDDVFIETLGDGEVRIRKGTPMTFEEAIGSMPGAWPPGYLEQLDAEERERG